MKSYIVKQGFTDINGAIMLPGDTISCNDARAALLRRYGKIGNAVDISKKVVLADAVLKNAHQENVVKNEGHETAVVSENKREKRGK